MTSDQQTLDPIHLVREIGGRTAVAVGLAGIGLIHLLDSIGKYSETRYLFWMYIALIAGSIAAAGAVLFTAAARVVSSPLPASPRAAAARLRAQPNHRAAERDRTTSATGPSRSASRACSSRAPSSPASVAAYAMVRPPRAAVAGCRRKLALAATH